MARLRYLVTIDGPAGAGKSSIAYLLARSLEYVYIDTGAIYRAITYKYILEGKKSLDKLLTDIRVDLRFKEDGVARVYIDDKDISLELRRRDVEERVSSLARERILRQFINSFLKYKIQEIILIKNKGIIIEGRDTGSVVCKDEADIKFYLDACLSCRTKRRFNQYKKIYGYEQVYTNLVMRDKSDTSREEGKLYKPEDTIYINTCYLKLKEVLYILKNKIYELTLKDGNNLKYDLLHWVGEVLFKLFFFLEVEGKGNLPASGGVLIISNHLSYLDPPALGAVSIRRLNYLARSSLFKNKLFSFFIKKLNAYPINQRGFDKSAIKKTLALLKQGRVIVLFPEGTRSLDGRLQVFKPGIGFLIKKAKQENIRFKIVLVRIYGTDKVLPKDSRFIRLFSKIRVKFGRPILPYEEISMSNSPQIADYLYKLMQKL